MAKHDVPNATRRGKDRSEAPYLRVGALPSISETGY